MVGGTEVLLYSKGSAEFLGEFCRESDISVGDYLLGNPVVWEDLLGVESSYALGVNCFLTGYEDGGFGEPLISYREDRVESFAIREFNDEVECNGLEREGVRCVSDWKDWWFRLIQAWFCGLTRGTSFDKVGDVVSNRWSPVVTRYHGERFSSSRMSCGREIVI